MVEERGLWSKNWSAVPGVYDGVNEEKAGRLTSRENAMTFTKGSKRGLVLQGFFRIERFRGDRAGAAAARDRLAAAGLDPDLVTR